MHYLEKKIKLFEALKKSDIYDSFNFYECEDDGESVRIVCDKEIEYYSYCSKMEAWEEDDGGFLIMLTLDNSINSSICMVLAKFDDEDKIDMKMKSDILNLLDRFNRESDIKFYILGEFIFSEITYTSNAFDADEYICLMRKMYLTIKEEEYYQEIMNILSGDADKW